MFLEGFIYLRGVEYFVIFERTRRFCSHLDLANAGDNAGSPSTCTASTSGLAPNCKRMSTCSRVPDCVSEESFDCERGAEDFSDEDYISQRASDEPEAKQCVRDGIRQGRFPLFWCAHYGNEMYKLENVF